MSSLGKEHFKGLTAAYGRAVYHTGVMHCFKDNALQMLHLRLIPQLSLDLLIIKGM